MNPLFQQKKSRSCRDSCDLPYEGAKEMLLVDEVDSKAFLTKLFEAMYDELPYQNKNKKTTECGRNHIHGKRESKISSIGGITDELYSDHKMQ